MSFKLIYGNNFCMGMIELEREHEEDVRALPGTPY